MQHRSERGAVLVTGGAGFLGQRVVRTLLQQGERPVVFDRNRHTGAAPFCQGDVLDRVALEQALGRYAVRRIIHLAAALPPETEADPAGSAKLNVIGTRNVFEAAVVAGIERVLYSSSIAVYGPQSVYGNRPVTEDDPPAPLSCYGMAKSANEQAAALFYRTTGLDIRILRLSSIFGHGRFKGVSGAMGGPLISLPAVGRPVEIEVAAREASSMLYVDDAAEICVDLLFSEALTSRLYLSGGTTATVEEISEIVRSIAPGARIVTGARKMHHVHAVDDARLRHDLRRPKPSLRARILEQMNEARCEAGLTPLAAGVNGLGSSATHSSDRQFAQGSGGR